MIHNNMKRFLATLFAICSLSSVCFAANTPDYRELFTRVTDGAYAEAHGYELRQVFERDPYEFVSRLSVYKVKWQLNVCFLLSAEYSIAGEPSELKGILSSLRKDDRPKTYLFHITLDNITNEARRCADRRGQDW